MMIFMGSIDLISGMALKTLFNLGKHSFGHNNKHDFSQSSDIAKTFMLLCLKCYVDKEDNLMCYAYLNVYALYGLHLSHHQLSVPSKPLLAKLCTKQISACASIPRNQYLPYESTIPSYSWY